jgi:FkbM family methyltransferase
MNIIKHQLDFNNSPFYFFAPENDSVVPGTVIGMQKDYWDLDKIPFEKDDIFIDIGCSVGIISMVFAKLYPYINIHSFDANPVAIECLRLGIKTNNINNISYYNLAVGAENKKDIKFLTYNENESCLIQNELCDNKNQRLKSYKCDMVSIANIFDNNIPENRKVKYLKIDIETGEFPLFEYIFNSRPDILDRIDYLHCEVHPFDDSNPPSKILKDKLKEKFGKKVRF